MKTAYCLLVIGLMAFAQPVLADVAPPEEEPTFKPAGLMLFGASVLMTVVNAELMLTSKPKVSPGALGAIVGGLSMIGGVALVASEEDWLGGALAAVGAVSTFSGVMAMTIARRQVSVEPTVSVKRGERTFAVTLRIGF